MPSVKLGSIVALALGAALAALTVARPAGAEIVDEQEVSHLTVGLSFGYQATRMNDFNDNLRVVNHFLNTNQGIRSADALSGGAMARGEIRYKIGQRVSLGFGAASTQARSAFSATWAEVNFFTRATVWSPMVYYHLPFVQTSKAFESVADRASLYLGAGPVFLSKGRAHMLIIDRTQGLVFLEDGDLSEMDGEGDATGTGTGLQGLVGASYQLTSKFSVAAELGYRKARIKDLKIIRAQGIITEESGTNPDRREPGDNAVIDFFKRDPNARRERGIPDADINENHIPYYSDYGTPLELDFSGVQATVGLRMHLF